MRINWWTTCFVNCAIIAAATHLPATSAIGAPEMPATRPATHPQLPAPGTPKRALVDFYDSVTSGRPELLRARTFAAGPDEEKVLDAMADVARGVAAVRAAAADKLGSAEAAKIRAETVPADVLSALREQVDGDRALLTMKGDPAGMALKKIGDAWKFDLAETFRRQHQQPAEVVRATWRSVERVDQVRRDVQAGKYKTAEEVGQALGVALEVRTESKPGKG
jgi:hypothetical protein